MMENEKSWRNECEINDQILELWKVMDQCIHRGCHSEGVLPGGLNVERRAGKLYTQLRKKEFLR